MVHFPVKNRSYAFEVLFGLYGSLLAWGAIASSIPRDHVNSLRRDRAHGVMLAVAISGWVHLASDQGAQGRLWS